MKQLKKKTKLIYDDFKQYEIPIDKEWETLLLTYGENHSYRFKFENGYGASVIKHFGSYGYESDLFELAVLTYEYDEFGTISYDTEIANDVIGYLNNDEVLGLLERIKSL